jgi:DNA anti-recombination protein RmuC
MVFGFGKPKRAWIREAKQTIIQMRHDASDDDSSTLSPDQRIAQAANHLSRSAQITRQIAHARSALAAGGTRRSEAIKAYGDEAQLDEIERDLREALSRVRETANKVFEESTERLAKRMNELARELTSTTHSAMPPSIIDAISILDQLKREHDQQAEAFLLERMRKNLESITQAIESLATNEPTSDTPADEPDSWMQAEVDREAHEDVKTQMRILTEIRTIIETFLEKRTADQP